MKSKLKKVKNMIWFTPRENMHTVTISKNGITFPIRTVEYMSKEYVTYPVYLKVGVEADKKRIVFKECLNKENCLKLIETAFGCCKIVSKTLMRYLESKGIEVTKTKRYELKAGDTIDSILDYGDTCEIVHYIDLEE